LREELGKSLSTTKAKLEEIEVMVKNTNEKTKVETAWSNPRPWSNPTDNQEWPLLPQLQNQSQNREANTPTTTQREAEAIHF
jgi:hypothetical protein